MDAKGEQEKQKETLYFHASKIVKASDFCKKCFITKELSLMNRAY
jgi:hypothetical protein